MAPLERVLVGSAAVLAFAAGALAIGSDVVLIKDINRSGYGSYPTNFFEITPDRSLFVASTGPTGSELWVTDGSAAGTMLLRDIYLGSTSSYPGAFRRVGNRVFFQATSQPSWVDIWSTDGSPAGTQQAATWYTGGGSGTGMVGTIGAGVIFRGIINNIDGLYITNGTPGGTLLLAAGCIASPYSAAPVQLGNTLLFSATTTASGSELWTTDGTPAGTRMVADISPGAAGSSPSDFTQFGSLVYFTATTPTSGRELWRTDGTTAGTVLFEDLRAGTASSQPSSLVVSGGKLYFTATDTTAVRCVYASTGIAPSSKVYEEYSQSNPGIGPLVAFQGGVAFNAPYAGDPSHWYIWTSAGAPADAQPAQPSTSSTSLYGTLNGRMLYAPNYTEVDSTDLSGAPPTTLFASGPNTTFRLGSSRALVTRSCGSGCYEHWTTDGTVAGTTRRVNANYPDVIAMSGGRFFYQNGTLEGSELWTTDGTPAGAHLVRDIDPRTFGSTLSPGFTLGNRFFFYVGGPNASATLWTSQGTPDSTALAIDPGILVPGQVMQAGSQAVLGDWVYFVTSMYSQSTGYSGTLYRSDGTIGNTTLVYQTPGGLDSPLRVGNEVWFTKSNGASSGLMRTDGTPAGTTQITSRLSTYRRRAAIGAGAVFLTSEPVLIGTSYETRFRIWSSDGTDAGTNPIWTSCASPYDLGMWSVGNAAYFMVQVYCGSSLYQVWRTDGTGPGTVLVMNSIYQPAFLGDLGAGDIAFFASPSNTTLQLYRTTGSGSGYQLLSNVTPDSLCSPACVSAARVNGIWLFSGRFGTTTGGELWRTDGTSTGTYLLADLNPGAGSSTPRNFYSDGQSATFVAASNAASVSDIWTSDGSASGTRRVNSIGHSSSSSSDPVVLGSSMDGVFLSAVNELLGRELHVFRPGMPDCNLNLIHDQLEIQLGLTPDLDMNGFPDSCCPADFNSDTHLNAQDIFDFLGSWFAVEPRADFNHSGGVSTQDIFDYLGSWFTGCP